MKYLVNKVTKEHRVLPTNVGWSPELWSVVQGDSEGWIKYKGNVNPLPPSCRVEIKIRNGTIFRERAAISNEWQKTYYYRPILEPEKVLNRLKAAHEAAQTIPDLEAELREVLGSMGYDLVARSPFVEAEADVKTPQGYVLMPLEPTENMLEAMHDNCFANPEWRKMCGFSKGKEIYRELLAHSLTKPEPAVETPQDNKYAAEW